MTDACAIGVDLGGTKLLAGAIAPDGTVLDTVYHRIAGLPLEELLDICVASAVAVGAGAGVPVGFGIPSLVDAATGSSLRCNHLPLDGVPFGEMMRWRLDLPVVVDNDANCATYAEWSCGAAAGCSHVVGLTLGTGIGGGLILDGRVYRGSVGAAAELGHMVIDFDGPSCFGTCPGRGCFEALCSGSALERDAAVVLGRPVSGEEVVSLASAGDPAAVSVVTEIGRRLGAGMAGLAMAFNPEVIVVGGGVIAAGEMVLAPARAELASRAMAPSREAKVVAAAFGDEAGMIGAALMAAEEL